MALKDRSKEKSSQWSEIEMMCLITYLVQKEKGPKGRKYRLIGSGQWPGWMVRLQEGERSEDEGQTGLGKKHVEGCLGVCTKYDLSITHK